MKQYFKTVRRITVFAMSALLLCGCQSNVQVNSPNQFAIVYDTYESAVKIEDGHIYQYEADDTWTDIGITGQASQVFSGEYVCVLMEDGSLYYDGMTVVPTEEVYSNLAAYGIFMAGKALEENETEPFVSVNQNMEFPGFRALMQSGEILYDNWEGEYKRFVLPEETPVFLSGEYVLSEEGNVFRLHADTDGFGRGPYTKLEQVYDGGDIAVISASETADCCIGIRENGRVVVWGEHQEGRETDWKNIVSVKQGFYCAVGLDAKGKVYYTDEKEKTTAKINEALSSWSGIKEIAVCGDLIAGMKEDGSCLFLHISEYK